MNRKIVGIENQIDPMRKSQTESTTYNICLFVLMLYILINNFSVMFTKLRIQEVNVAVALRTKRLRWYGHVAHASRGQIQLPVSPSLALEDVGDQGSLGVSVLKPMLMCAT